MPAEDEGERLIRMISERRRTIIDGIAHGAPSADNIATGYREMTGWVKALDDIEEMVRKVYSAWLPARVPVKDDPPKRSGEY